MSASPAGHERQETSRRRMEKCLALLKESVSDDDKFGTLLQITCHIRSDELTYEDRKTVLEAAGLDFLVKLVKSELKPSHGHTSFYKTAALSILSVWTVDPYIAGQATMKDFLSLVNEVISAKHDIDKTKNVSASQDQTCSDCEEIILNLSKNRPSMDCLLQAGTISLMFEHCVSPRCENVKFVLSSLAAAAEFTGGNVSGVGSRQLVTVVRLATHKLKQSDIKEKLEYAKILTSFLNWFYLEEVTVQEDWVVQLVQVLDKLLVARFASDDEGTVFDLLCSLVSTTGSEVFSSVTTQSHNFLRCVTARLSVEVYMLLDHISLEEISYRYRKLDRTYKLLTSLIQFVVDHGESVDSESFVVVYRKLVEIGNTIVQFLCSVDNQTIHLPKTHKLVLMTVKALAAILSNVTEEPTPDLLSVLPLLNMLCQNVKRSEVNGVKQSDGEVKCSEVSGVRHAPDCVTALSSLSLQSSDFDKSEIQSNSCQQEVVAHDDEDACLSQESLERFIQFQDSMKKLRAKLEPSSTKNVSFLGPIRNERIKQVSIQDQSEQRMVVSDQSDQWMPTPDDVLGCLLPAYTFLLESAKAVEVMLQCGIFQTVITFVDTSLSDLIDNRSSSCPETSIVNGLSLIQSVYTNMPAKAASINYFHEFFKTSLSSLPCLLSLASPPPGVCLKLMEVTLTAYRSHIVKNKRCISLAHSQDRLFSVILEYLSSFYKFRQKKKSQCVCVSINDKFVDIWFLIVDSWSNCMDGIASLAGLVQELQDVLNTAPMLPDCLAYLASCEVSDTMTRQRQHQPAETVDQVTKSLLLLTETVAASSPTLCQFILRHQGHHIARKFGLSKLELCLLNMSKTTGSDI